MRQLAARRRLSRRNVLACGLTRLSPVLPLQNRAFFSVQFPLNTGFRFSMNACTASLWSAVTWVRIMRSAS